MELNVGVGHETIVRMVTDSARRFTMLRLGYLSPYLEIFFIQHQRAEDVPSAR
jgi:hypothetical protein